MEYPFLEINLEIAKQIIDKKREFGFSNVEGRWLSSYIIYQPTE